MKKVFFCVLILFICNSRGFGQCIQSGNLSGWVTQGIVSTVSSANGVDQFGLFPLGSPASGLAIKIGDHVTHPQPFSSASTTFTVSASAPFLQYYYAMVNLNYPHDQTLAATSSIQIKDPNGNVIPCGEYEIFASATGPSGFLISNSPPRNNYSVPPEGPYTISYLPWSTSVIDLSAFVNQVVTIELSNKWCFYGVDWGYGYFDAKCVNFEIAETCLPNGASLLTAPQGGSAYLWSNGSTTPSIQVTSPGTYTCQVSLVQGSSCSISLSVDANPASSSISLTTSNACLGEIVGFSSQINSTSNILHQWDFGDGNSSNVSNPQHIYSAPGVYDVSLITINISSNGCSDTNFAQVVVQPLPHADFLASNQCFGQSLQVSNNSVPPSSQSVSYLWNFGDLTTSVDPLPQHIYSAPGTYLITLKVSSPFGCVDSVTNQVVIYHLPVPDVAPIGEKCLVADLRIYDNSSVSDGFITSWNWVFPNGFSSSERNPVFPIAAPGIYDVYLKVTSSNGCVSDSTFIEAIQFLPVPFAAFTYTPDLPDIFFPKVYFINRSINNEVNEWGFPNGISSIETNPVFEFDKPGEFIVQLIVRNEYGCPDTAVRKIRLLNNSSFWLPNAFTPNNDLLNDTFLPAAFNVTDFVIRIFDRWGNEAFKSNLLEFGWDGNINGSPAPQDVYCYMVEYKDHELKLRQLYGRVSLIR